MMEMKTKVLCVMPPILVVAKPLEPLSEAPGSATAHVPNIWPLNGIFEHISMISIIH